MNKPIPFHDTVFAFEPSLLSENYVQFDSIISKFGPENGKYLAAIPGSTTYRKSIADELMIKLGAQSNKYLKARVKLLPGGGKRSVFFYPFDDLSLNEDDFMNAAIKAKNQLLVHHVVSAQKADNAEYFDSGDFDPNDYCTKEAIIETTVGDQNITITQICQLLEPIINLHEVLHYVDPYFNAINKVEYVNLWKHIFKLFNGKKAKKALNIHTEKYFTQADFVREFGEYIKSGVKVVIHIYEEDRRSHDRLFFGEHGGWKNGRGFLLSKKDTIILDSTAIGKGSGIESRIAYLDKITKVHQFTYEA